ncbi:hypothetical protein FH972_026118 [Carpinus fangiana]|uniref:Ubiquitin-like domain-containing protein n=1 Tax=Carpinus fangiana TaxID=176857 RepID=A0A5N6L307_9ROSI|nr:hypothetical protein FH972_026118 [Carpinus fangiana]
MKISLVRQDRDDDIMPYDVSTETSVGDLKAIIAAETDLPPASFTIVHNDTPLLDDSKTLGAAGISDGDLMSLVLQSASSSSSNNPPQGQGSSDASVNAQVEELRQRLLASPEMQRTYGERMPDLLSNLNNPTAFRETVISLETQRRAAQDQHDTQLAALNNDVNEENQAKILEMIRQEQIDREMETTMQTNPELFGRVTMLYVDVHVNGTPVKAFVDSGAQATIMSPDCAERCNVTRLIDRRWQGTARGVGTARILGRVHRAALRLGHDEVPCAFTVMEGKDVDLLLGLDMLKRYQACIDLAQGRLVFPGGQSVPFLPESEIPKSFEEAAAQEPTVAGPGDVEDMKGDGMMWTFCSCSSTKKEPLMLIA